LTRADDFMIADLQSLWLCGWAQGQHAAIYALLASALAKLINDLFDAAGGIGQVGLEEMQYAHESSS